MFSFKTTINNYLAPWGQNEILIVAQHGLHNVSSLYVKSLKLHVSKYLWYSGTITGIHDSLWYNVINFLRFKTHFMYLNISYIIAMFLFRALF